MILKTFGWSFGLTALALVASLFIWDASSMAIVAILIVMEISLSFDNAVVNARVLARMNAYWQKIFLTVGMVIAVFGMRLIFPLLLVAITAQLNPVDVVHLALKGGSADEPGTYAHALHDAHPAIAAFGGMFLLMLFLDFIFEEHEYTWLTWLEKPLARLGKVDVLSIVVGLVVLVVAGQTLAENPTTVLTSGALGLVAYLLVDAFSSYFEEGMEGDEDDEEGDEAPAGSSGGAGVKQLAGRAAFMLFIYLEVLDSSFSFDGVIGAFAISQDIFIIAIGLGVGALYIRSLTIYLVRKGTLSDYVYLEHGAMWAIGVLAVILLITIRHEVPEVVTGLIGVAFIAASFGSSVVRNRRIAAAAA